MLASIGKLIPLALSTGALICLVVVFVGCTSPSSPNDLYFMKVSHRVLGAEYQANCGIEGELV